jgi:hypothetical protein
VEWPGERLGGVLFVCFSTCVRVRTCLLRVHVRGTAAEGRAAVALGERSSKFVRLKSDARILGGSGRLHHNLTAANGIDRACSLQARRTREALALVYSEPSASACRGSSPDRPRPSITSTAAAWCPSTLRTQPALCSAVSQDRLAKKKYE